MREKPLRKWRATTKTTGAPDVTDPQTIIAGLVQRGLPLHVAQGIAANMMAESRLDPGINELAPLVPGSRGGFGLNQWTGPRRRALEAAAEQRGVPVNDLGFQLDFTLEELQGPERRSMNALSGAQDAETAARIFSEQFLRPGIPHLDRRLSYARQFSGMDGRPRAMGEEVAQAPAPPSMQQQQPNALAQMQMAQQIMQRFGPQNNALDPAAFQSRRRF